MPRYIDISSYEDCRIVLNGEDKGIKIPAIPTADVQEVKHGHWIKDPESGITRCSECDWTLEVAWESNYCPDCGAKMYEEVTK